MMKNLFICILFCLFISISVYSATSIEPLAGRSLYGQEVPGQVNSIRWEWVGEPQWLTGVDWGGLTFSGGLDFGVNFFGSAILPESVPNVEIRFSNTVTSQAYVYRRDLGYSYSGLGSFPGSAWDISDPGNPRRLDICFVEISDTAAGNIANHIWDPNSDVPGKREYVFIMSSNYNPVANDPFYSQKNLANDSDQFQTLYALWASVTPGYNLLDSDAVFRFVNVPVHYEDVTIMDLQNVPNPAENDTSSFLGDTVRITGLMMDNPRDTWIGARWGAFVVDPNTYPAPGSGIFVIQNDTSGNNTRFDYRKAGDVCEFIGVIDEYYHFTQLNLLTDTPVQVQYVETADSLPPPAVINAAELSDPATAEKWESMFVRIENTRLVGDVVSDRDRLFTDNSGFVASLSDYFNWFHSRLLSGSYIWPPADTRLNLQGFVRDVIISDRRVYDLNPRTPDDLQPITGLPQVILTEPNGGDAINQAMYRWIRWIIYDIPEVQNIKLEYSLDNGGSYNLINNLTNVSAKGFSWFAPDEVSQEVRIKITVTDNNANSYSDVSDKPFEIRKLDRYVYHTGTLSHTIRADGSSGNEGIFNNLNLDEPSLEFPAQSGHNHLYESDLIMGMIRASGDTTFLIPFAMKYFQTQDLTSVDHGNYIETDCRFADNAGLALDIGQKTYAKTGESWVIFNYSINNTSGEKYRGVTIGVHNDFDINQPLSNLVGYNNTSRLAYMYDATGGWSSMAGVCLLSAPVQSFRRYSGAEGPQSPGEFYRVFSAAGLDDPSGDAQADYQVMLSQAPEDLGPSATTGITFALVAGNSETELINAVQQAQSFWQSLSDEVAPTISLMTVPSTTAGDPMTISAGVTDNTGVASVQLFYRRGGDLNFDSMNMTLSGSQYKATVAGDYISDTGLEIRIEARDANDNLAVLHQMMPVRVPDGQEQIEVPGGSHTENYRMISVPLQLDNGSVDNVLVDDFGSYDNTKWRLFRDGGSAFIEYPNTGPFAPGKAFWLITSETKTFDIPAGSTVSAENFYTIPLQKDWNQIASPYDFDVGWQDIMILNNQPDMDGPFFYRGSAGYSLEELISPFDGCYINNMTGSGLSLKIPLKGKDASVSKTVVPKNWQVQIMTESGGVRDDLTILGVNAEANETRDRLDHLEPPVVGQYISAYFPHDDWRMYPAGYSVDFRPVPKDGVVWNIRIRTNIRDHTVNLKFFERNRDLLATEYNIYLIDPASGLIRDLRRDPTYTYMPARSDQEKMLQVVVGTRQFVAEKFPDLPLVPVSLELKQNYPNPFNPVTQIVYGLPASTQVNLTIYDLAGRVVKILQDGFQEAGYQIVDWTGNNQQGRKVASGVYIYSLTAGAERLARKMVLVR